MRRYLWNLLIALDQLANALFAGHPDETISSRLGKLRDQGASIGRIGCSLLDRIDPHHCDEAKEDVT